MALILWDKEQLQQARFWRETARSGQAKIGSNENTI